MAAVLLIQIVFDSPIFPLSFLAGTFYLYLFLANKLRLRNTIKVKLTWSYIIGNIGKTKSLQKICEQVAQCKIEHDINFELFQ